MKVKLINEKMEFQPVKIEITIETPGELCDLWHRLNVGTNTLGKYSDIEKLVYGPSIMDMDLFDLIDRIVEKNDLKNK